jgi:membrane-bound lytic murein transglycosylase D
MKIYPKPCSVKLGRRFSLISADNYSISSLYLKCLESAFISVQKGNSYAIKIFLVMIALLFCAGCAIDTSYLKPQKQPPPDEVVAKESHPKPSPTSSEQKIPAPAKVEEKQEIPALPKIEEEQKVAGPNRVEEEKEKFAAPAKIEEEQEPAAPPKVEEKEKIPPPAKVEEKQEVLAPAKAEDKEKTDTPVKAEEEKIAAPAPVEEKQEVAAPAKVEEEEKIVTLAKVEEKEKIPSPAKVEQKEAAAPATIEEKESLPLPKTPESSPLHPAQQTQKKEEIAPPAKVEEKQEIAPPVRAEEEEKVDAPAKVEEEKKVAALPKVEEEQKITPPVKVKEEPLLLPEAPESSPFPPSPQTQKKSDQEMLDSALEFCQASYDFWEQGDLSNAIDALDQAYSLILKVNANHDPEILQQREDLRFTISKRIIECYSSRFTVANGYHKAIPLVMNRHVEKALKMFKGQEKSFFLNAYRVSGRYRPAIIRALKEAGLPEELSWLPLIESGFKIRALSRSRALGLWQFIASTGYKFGLKRDYWIDERMDPEKSTRAAIAYLKELHRIFGDWTTALAAYNCGEGTVLKSIRTQRINYLDHFWDLYKKLPRETAFYVPKFMAVLHILNDPEAHGFILPPVHEEIRTEEVTIDKQVHLKTMAKYLGISYEALKDLNPALRRNATPNRPYAFKVPIGKGAVLLSNLGDIPVWRPPVPVYVWHRVRNGESLSVIARRYRTSVRAIMALNGLKSRHFIRAGRKLKIPTRRTYVPLRKASLPVPGSKVKGNLIEYVVRKGDSLWRIANRFGTTTKAIQSVNQLSSTHLWIGQVLMIPKGLTALKRMKTKTYTVLEGDSPYIIAQKHQMNLSEFLRLNHLTPRSTIFPGQVLLVKAE